MEASKLRRLEQQKWLDKHASREISSAQSLHHRNEALLKGLLDGGASLLELHTNLHFAKAQPGGTLLADTTERPRGFKFNEARLERSALFNSSMQRIQDYDTTKRWAAGVHGMTLLTEYRRKLIFHAMLASGDVLEERSSAREKLDAYLQLYAPELLDTEDNEEVGTETAGARAAAGGTYEKVTLPLLSPPIKYTKQKQKQKSKNGETNFSPKMEDYDIMRNRWRFVQPQLRDFSNFASTQLTPPTTGEKVVSLGDDGVRLRGTFSEAKNYLKRNSKGKSPS